MTPDEVQRRVEQVRHIAAPPIPDNESAHEEQDALLVDVLRAMEKGRVDAGEFRAVATEALKILDVDFLRWYA